MLKSLHVRMSLVLIAIIAAILLLSSARVHAQQATAEYTIVQSDNVWAVIDAKCGTGAGANWRTYLAMPENSALNTGNRAFKVRTGPNAGSDGWLVHAGERITLPTSTCNLPTSALVPVAVAPANPPAPTLAQIGNLIDQKLLGLMPYGYIPWWLWLILLALVAALAYYFARHHGAESEGRIRENARVMHEAAENVEAAIQRLNGHLEEFDEILFGDNDEAEPRIPVINISGNNNNTNVVVGDGNGYPRLPLLPQPVIFVDVHEPAREQAPAQNGAAAPAPEPAPVG